MRPTLHCPFEVTPSHPETAALMRGCLSWARSHQLLPDESAATLAKVESYSSLAARCYPNAPLERLAVICDYYSWLFFFDDACEDLSLEGAEPARVLQLLRGAYAVVHDEPAPSEPSRFVTALSDIWRRLALHSPESWRRRLSLHVRNYIDGCVWEAQNRALDCVPSRAVFEAMRMHTSTMYEFWDFMEYAGGFFLPDAVLEEPLVAELRRTANAVASFANDIYSLGKELGDRDVHNLVIVIEHEEGVSRSAACARAVAIHDAQARHFVRLSRCLPSFDAETDQLLARYVEGMQIWMRANYDWSCVTPRYAAKLAESA